MDIKNGVEISHCTKGSVIFSDGSELEADVLIFACVIVTFSYYYLADDDFRTGYESSLEAYKKVFDPALIEQTPHLWGLDEEMEIRGVYRPTPHPGVS